MHNIFNRPRDINNSQPFIGSYYYTRFYVLKCIIGWLKHQTNNQRQEKVEIFTIFTKFKNWKPYKYIDIHIYRDHTYIIYSLYKCISSSSSGMYNLSRVT